jgi:hypothetical protein
VLVGIGLWIRLGILETPVFQKLVESDRIEKAPIVEVIRKQPREIILSALLRMAEQAPFYIAACAVVSVVSAAMMPDYTGRDISQEYVERAGERLAA